jgi:hypothetical protein
MSTIFVLSVFLVILVIQKTSSVTGHFISNAVLKTVFRKGSKKKHFSKLKKKILTKQSVVDSTTRF